MNLSKNSSKKPLRLIVVIVLIVAAALALSLTLYNTSKRPAENTGVPIPTPAQAIAPSKQTEVNPGLPSRLKIPKIGVDATIDHLGTTPQGEMSTPDGPDNAGWFKLGPRPGENGNAVISGHFGYKNNLPAVFDNLHKLQKADKLYTTNQKGEITTFVVRELRTYAPNENATDIFRSSDGQAHLNLITCQGIWNQAQKSYSTRLVVFTDEIIEQ